MIRFALGILGGAHLGLTCRYWRHGFYDRFGVTSEDDIDTIVDKVTQYLSTLCQ
jgi:hypothetical protein